MRPATNTFKNISAAAIVAIFFLTGNAFAAWGDYDTNFGYLGKVTDSMTNYVPSDVLIQPDGKIVVVGHYRNGYDKTRLFVRRYFANGSVDSAFGQNGTAFSGGLMATDGHYWGESVAILPDGKIAVVGAGNGRLAAWRFLPNGSFDSGFGYRGSRTYSEFAGHSWPNYITVQNGKLILSTQTGEGGTGPLAILRLNDNGSIDTSFADQGVLQTTCNSYSYRLLVEKESLKITVGGKCGGSNGYSVSRWTADGDIDYSMTQQPSDLPDQLESGDFIRLASGKYLFSASDMRDYLNPRSVDRNLLNLYFANGVIESTVDYHTGNHPYNKCPTFLDQQDNGKIVASTRSKMYRINENLDPSTVQTGHCNSYGHLWPRIAVMRGDDKLVVVGQNENGNLSLVRTLGY